MCLVFLYPHYSTFNEALNYHSDDFKRTVRIKIKIVTAALMLGFQTLFTAVDVVFLRDPVPFLPTNADLAIQDDMGSGLNSGFLLVRPTYGGVNLMQRTLDIVMNEIIFDQKALNMVINDMVGKNSLNMKILDKQLFACGIAYFEDGKICSWMTETI